MFILQIRKKSTSAWLKVKILRTQEEATNLGYQKLTKEFNEYRVLNRQGVLVAKARKGRGR